MKQDRKREAQSNQPSSAANLAAQVRHSKAAQDAVTAFTTLATRAALKKGSGVYACTKCSNIEHTVSDYIHCIFPLLTMYYTHVPGGPFDVGSTISMICTGLLYTWRLILVFYLAFEQPRQSLC